MTVVNCDKKDCKHNSKCKETTYSCEDGVCTAESIQIENQGMSVSCNSYEETW